jgi:hypothetical protein
MLTIESETFKIDAPDEIGKFSAQLYEELVGLVPAREGKLLKFASAAQAKRVVNDLVLLGEHDKNNVYVDKVRGTHHRRIYIRPMKESA